LEEKSPDLAEVQETDEPLVNPRPKEKTYRAVPICVTDDAPPEISP
jgi:hypothetical protein